MRQIKSRKVNIYNYSSKYKCLKRTQVVALCKYLRHQGISLTSDCSGNKRPLQYPPPSLRDTSASGGQAGHISRALNNSPARHSGLLAGRLPGDPESRRRPREGGEPNHFLLDSCFRRNDKNSFIRFLGSHFFYVKIR